MSYLKYFYKEAGTEQSVYQLVKNLLGIQDPLNFTSQGPSDAKAYVTQKQMEDPDGNIVSVEDPDKNINIKNDALSNMLKNTDKNLSESDIRNMLREFGQNNIPTIQDIKNNPDGFKDTMDVIEEYYNLRDLPAAIGDAGETLVHEKTHKDVEHGEEMKGEDEAEKSEHLGLQSIISKLKAAFPNLDENIKKVQALIKDLPKLLEDLKNAGSFIEQAANDHEISVKSSIINKDINSLVKIANYLDKLGYVQEADFVDSISEFILE